MISKYFRNIVICITLFGLTSSCEDKERQSFGKVNLTFDYQETVEATDTSSNDTTQNRTTDSEPSQDEFEREQAFIKDRDRSETSLEIDIIIDENEDLIERSSKIKQDYCCARIQINNGTPLTLDLSNQNTYSRTVPIGTALINVDLLTFSNIVLYNAVKNVQVNEDVNTSVSFIPSDWVVQNQEIEITSEFNSIYTIGDNIPIAWTNTHTARGVKIEMIQSTTTNVLKVLENNFIGDSYTFDTSNESARNNVGIKVTSMLNETMSSRCCFDIAPPNEAPTVENVSETTDEDQSVEVQLNGNDNDGDSVTFSIVSNPSNGSLGSINDNKVTYTPSQDFNGTDTFTYKANDGTLDSNTATVTLTVNSINDAPTTVDVSVEMDENLSIDRIVGITLEGNDVDGDNLTYSIVSDPSNGSLSAISSNTVTYTPTQDFNGTDTFTYKANDGTVDSNTSTVTITVDAVNDAPVTQNQSASTNEDTAVTKTLSVVDIDTQQGMTRSIVSNPSNGSVVLTGSGSQIATYIPNANWNGTDTFTWKANDGTLDSNTSTVTITVTAVNDAPTTDGGKTYSTPKNTPISITLGGNDIEGDALSYIITEDNVTSSGHATLSLDGNVVTITPTSNPSTNIKVNFRYKVNDGNLDSDEANVITYITANEFTNPISGQVWGKGNTETIDWSGSFENDPWGIYLVRQLYNNGPVTPIIEGGIGDIESFDYTIPTSLPNASDYQIFIGQLTNGLPDGEYILSDLFELSDNNRPTINDMTINTAVNTALEFSLEGSDADGDALSYIIVTQPEDGTITGIDSSVLDDNTGTYSPNTNNTGVDSFTYKVNDGTHDSAIGTVLVDISNSAPSTADVTFATDEDTPYNYTLPAIDSEGDSLTYIVVNGPNTNDNNGSASISGHIATFTPNQDWNGSDYFTVRANDRLLDGNNAKINVQVDPVDDPPYVSNPSYSTDEDVSINFGRNTGYYGSWGGDIDSGQLTIDILQQPVNGDLVQIGAGGTNFDMHYEPDEDFFGSDSIKYQLTNKDSPRLTSEIGTVMIDINAINDAPKSKNFTISTDKNIPFSINIIENTDYTDVHGNGPNFVTDVDTELSELSAMFNDGTTTTKSFEEGTMTFNNNILTYVPAEDWTGNEPNVVQYKVYDGELYSNNAEGNDGTYFGLVSVIVTNNAPVSSDVSVSTEQNLVKSITFDGEDINGDDLTYSIVSNPSNGTLGNISGNTILYTPNNNWFGTDSFTYKANDGTADSNVSTVTITVNQSATTTDNYQPDGSDFSMPQREYFELPFSINDQGEITDINIDISFTHGASNGLDETKMYLLSPNLTLLKFFDFQNAEKQLLNTTFDDEADDNFSDGSNPFIGSFKPLNNLSVFDGEDLNGEWKLIIRNNYCCAGAVLNSFKLQITRKNDSSGTTYNEDYSDFTIYDDTDRSFPQNITSTFTIPFGEYISSGSVVDDFHIELSVKHGANDGLNQLKIAFDDNVSTSSLRKVFDFNKLSDDDILKLRFTNNNNDPSYDTINDQLYTRVKAEESWTNFANTKPDSLRFYVANNYCCAGLVIDDIKIYGKEKIASGNSYGATSLYFTNNSAIGQTNQAYRNKDDITGFDFDSFSFSTWIKPDDPWRHNGSGTGIIFSHWNEQGNARYLWIGLKEDGTLRVGIKPDFTTNSYDISSAAGVVPMNNGWQHIVITLDSGGGGGVGADTVSYYVNGDYVGNNSAGSIGELNSIDGYIVFGTLQTGNPSNQFTGKIDETAFWDTVLDTDDITEIYNNGIGLENLMSSGTNYNEEGSIIGYWRFNEGSGTVASDNSNNANHLDHLNTHQQSGGSFDESAIWSTE